MSFIINYRVTIMNRATDKYIKSQRRAYYFYVIVLGSVVMGSLYGQWAV